MHFIETILPPHFTSRNRIIFFLALLFSFTSLVALLKVQPKDEGQPRKMVATLADQKQYVTRKFSNSLSFIEIEKGDKLYNGDQIFTGNNSGAKVVFLKSGNILNIPPKGLVKIEEGLSGENIDVQKGLAEFVIQKGQSMNFVQGTETITLKSDVNEMGSGKIFFNQKKLTLQVDSGKISLNDSLGKVQKVNKNESISLAPIKKIVGAGLTKPDFGQKVDIWEGLSLEWSKKGAIDVVLSKDRDFKEVIGRTTAARSPYKWLLPLQEGQYYIKVNAVDKKVNEVVTIPLVMYSSHKISKFMPADKSSVNLKRGDSLKLSWSAVPATRYKVTLVNDEGKTSSFMTTKAEYVVQKIKGSILNWSVAPQLPSGVLLSDPVTNHVNLAFGDENTIITPKIDQSFLFGKEKVELNWNTTKDERTHIKLVNTSLNQTIIDKDTTDNKLTFTPEAPGVYSLKISSRDFPNPSLVGVKFLVVSPIAEWELKAPVEFSSYEFEEKKVELKFIPKNKDLTQYELSVYTDFELKNKIITSKVPTNTILYRVKKFGTLCFILRALDKKSSWLPSDSQCINYTKKEPLLPIAEWELKAPVELSSYEFEEKKVELKFIPKNKDLTQYELSVFNGTDLKNKLFSSKVPTNKILFKVKSFGTFCFVLRPLEKYLSWLPSASQCINYTKKERPTQIAEWELKAPVELSSFENEEMKVELKFIPKNKDLTQYELSVYNGTDLKNKIATSDVSSDTILYKLESFGTYCFILGPLEKDSRWLPSNSQCINYTKKAPLLPIAEWELKAPVEFSSIDFEEKKVELKFIPKNKDLTKYELSVYNDTVLRNKIFSSKVPSTSILYRVKKFGTYCFILRLLEKNASWLPSDSQCIIYTEKDAFEEIASTKDIILKYVEVNGVGSYLINLPEDSRASIYEIQVSDDSQRVVFTDRSKKNVITWPTNKTGIFSYKYRLVDSKGRTSKYSDESKLIFPVSPLTDWNE